MVAGNVVGSGKGSIRPKSQLKGTESERKGTNIMRDDDEQV